MTTRLEDVRVELVGAWRLNAYQVIGPDGAVVYPLGLSVTGQLIHEEGGRVSMHVCNADVPRFADDNWQQASQQEQSAAWLGYVGYFGNYEVDPDREMLVHDIVGSWFPNMAGTRRQCRFRVEGDELTLFEDAPPSQIRQTWSRIGNAEG